MTEKCRRPRTSKKISRDNTKVQRVTSFPKTSEVEKCGNIFGSRLPNHQRCEILYGHWTILHCSGHSYLRRVQNSNQKCPSLKTSSSSSSSTTTTKTSAVFNADQKGQKQTKRARDIHERTRCSLLSFTTSFNF